MRTAPLKRWVEPQRPITYGIVQAGPDVEGGVPYIRPVDMDGHRGIPDPSALRTTAPGIAEQYRRSSVEPGDVVVAIGPSYGKTMIVPPALDGANLTQGTARVAPAGGVDARYLVWALQARLATDFWDAAVGGATFRALNLEPLAQTPIPVRALDAQRAIADFLDAETTRIDALIEKKRRLLELLEHRRKSVMAEGVGGRITASGERREAGVPWMSARPERWRDTRLTVVARLGSGHTPSREHPEWWEDCSIPWITTGEVSQMRSDRIEFITDTREMISELGLANSAARIHPAGTVVLCRTAASAGYSAIMGRDMATSQDFATWTCGPLLRPRFLLLCLRTMRQDLLGRLAMGSTHRTIYMPDIEAIRIPLPPVEEQDLIVAGVWSQLRPADEAADLLSHQIDLLLERRQALITAAVTGDLPLGEAA